MARPAGGIRPPGVYISHVEAINRSFVLGDTRGARCARLAAKGPLDVPMRITSWDEYVEIYGNVDVGYLSNSVEGFFLNGGLTCYVVRVAHSARNGVEPDFEHAYAAERVIKDAFDKPTLRVRARSE